MKYAIFDGSSWSTETVDSEGKVNYYSSLAFDSSGNPAIAYSYFDSDNHDLKYAIFDGSSWSTEIVDSEGLIYSSLAFDSSGNPAIAYYGGLYNDLKYALYDCEEDTNSCVDADCSPYVCEDADSCYGSCTSESDCASGYECVDNVCSETVVVTGAEDCDNSIDDDLNGLIDLTGGCETDGDSNNIEYVCGCQNDDDGLFYSYGDSDITCDSTEVYRCYKFSDVNKDADDVTCSILGGTYYSSDNACTITTEDCLNGIDDDGDGLVDFDDTEDCSVIDYISSCKDSDSSESDPYLVKGIVSYVLTDGSTVTYAEDYCDTTTTDLWEYGCFDYDGNSGPGGNKVNCESLYGTSCTDGACEEDTTDDCSYKMNIDDSFSYDSKEFNFSGFEVNKESTSTTPEYYGVFYYDSVKYKLLEGQSKELSQTFSLSLDNIVNDVMTGSQYVNITGVMTECPTIDRIVEIEESCDDGLDDDNDGYTDCEDYDCKDNSICIFECNDGIDNDKDEGIDRFGACKIAGTIILTCQEVFSQEIPKGSNRDSVAESCYMSCYIYNADFDPEYIAYDSQCVNQTDDKEKKYSVIESTGGISIFDVSKIEIIFEDPRGILIGPDWHETNEPEIYDFSSAIIWESTIINEDLSEGVILVENYIDETATYGGVIDMLKDNNYQLAEIAEILASGKIDIAIGTMALDNSYTTDVSKQIIVGFGKGGFNDYGLAISSVIMGKKPSKFSISSDAISFVQGESVVNDIKTIMTQYSSELMVNSRLVSAGVKTQVMSSPEQELSLWQKFWSFVLRR